jgi:hypothetical protein
VAARACTAATIATIAAGFPTTIRSPPASRKSIARRPADIDDTAVAVSDAIVDVARTYGLASDWVNLGPESLLDLGLPDGFLGRLERHGYGGIVAWLADRRDMVCFKLYAAVDQGTRSRHLQDLRELRPDRDELLAAARWSVTHDPSPGYRSLLVDTLRHLGMEDAGGSLG